MASEKRIPSLKKVMQEYSSLPSCSEDGLTKIFFLANCSKLRDEDVKLILEEMHNRTDVIVKYEGNLYQIKYTNVMNTWVNFQIRPVEIIEF